VEHLRGACSSLTQNPELMAESDDDAAALALARIEAHYFVNQFSCLNRRCSKAWAAAHLPCTIVQGRYDVVCPPGTAFDLHAAWPEAELVVVPDAGHSAWEPGITRELVSRPKR
jgi:proline iminopeptidase